MVIRRSLASFGLPPRRPGVVAYLRSLGLSVTQDADWVRVGDAR